MLRVQSSSVGPCSTEYKRRVASQVPSVQRTFVIRGCTLHRRVAPEGTHPSCRPSAYGPKRHVQRAQPCKAVATSSQADSTHLDQYELIIVGSGNGACAFISKYLTATRGQPNWQNRKILVIEEGQPFLKISAITHQANWTQSYSEGSIYKLHTTTTGPNAGNRPIISGRAVTQGGGGSINYTMIHESSDWLAQQLGAGGQYDAAYWDTLKAEIGALFHRRDPAPDRTPVAETLFKALTDSKGGGPFAAVPDNSSTGNIPQYIDGQAPGNALGRVYTFPTQFNDWGERTNSGVSLVAGGRDWRRSGRVDLWTDARVEELQFGRRTDTNGGPLKVPCTGLTVRHLGPKRDCIQRVTFDPQQTTVILAAGSSTPRLLLPHKEQLQNQAIGSGVSDHILLPVGFYSLKQDASGFPTVSPKDQYLPLFAEQEATVSIPTSSKISSSSTTTTTSSSSSTSAPVVVGYDFFAGPVSDLSYYLAHLFVSLWMPNALKTACINNPWLFQQLKSLTANGIRVVEWGVNCWYGWRNNGRDFPPVNVITGIVKFNIFYEGHYEPQSEQPSDASTRIVLNCFADQPNGRCAGDAAASPDGLAALQTLPALMRKLDAVGDRPWRWAQWLLKKAVAMPYDPDCREDIEAYVRKYADQHLLTQQHLSGGCVLGAAAEDGSVGPDTVGLVRGTANVVVSDLSAVPLPRVSPQMTAYLLGYHIATQRYGQREAPAAGQKAQTAAANASSAA